MANCQELFSILGVLFPNRLRALMSDGELEGVSGRFNPETLREMSAGIEAACPTHAAFQVEGTINRRISYIQTLGSAPARSNFLVKYVHAHHEPGRCHVLAISTGPLEAIGELKMKSPHPLPLTAKEMEVALAIAAGKSLQQIASETNLSVHTVRNQLKSSLRSTGMHSQSQLAFLIRDWLF